jgi:hypothetical protein
MTSAFTILRATQLEADRARDECEAGLRADYANHPERLAYYLGLLEQMHERNKKRIATLAK